MTVGLVYPESPFCHVLGFQSAQNDYINANENSGIAIPITTDDDLLVQSTCHCFYCKIYAFDRASAPGALLAILPLVFYSLTDALDESSSIGSLEGLTEEDGTQVWNMATAICHTLLAVATVMRIHQSPNSNHP